MTHLKKWRMGTGSYKAKCKDDYALEYEKVSFRESYMDGNPTRIRPKLVRIR